MESMSLRQVQVIEDQLRQIEEAIHNLQEWNRPLENVDQLLMSFCMT